MFEAFAVSTGVVALGEVGDKTQLLALLLAARWRRPLPIVAGILVATLLNHALAVALGGWLAALLDPHWLRWALGLSFLAVATVMLAMKYGQPLAVTLGTTLGMLIANVPVVLLGERALRALPGLGAPHRRGGLRAAGRGGAAGGGLSNPSAAGPTATTVGHGRRTSRSCTAAHVLHGRQATNPSGRRLVHRSARSARRCAARHVPQQTATDPSPHAQ